MKKGGRKEVRNELKQVFALGESVRLISLPGSGLSHWLRNGLQLDIEWVYIDCANLNMSRVVELEHELATPAVIVLDHFDLILEREQKVICSKLRSLRDRNKYKVSFIFVNNKVRNWLPYVGVMDGLFEIATEHLIYFPLFDREDTMDMVVKIGDRRKRSWSEKETENIYQLSGGLSSLVKTCLLEEEVPVAEKLLSRDQVLGKLERVWNFLTEEEQKYYEHGLYLSRLTCPRSLLELGLRKKKFELWDRWLKLQFLGSEVWGEVINDLTVLEERMFGFLIGNRGRVCLRDDLIAVGWVGDDPAGVSDQALDKVISRLRGKLDNHGMKLETRRGKGFVLQ